MSKTADRARRRAAAGAEQWLCDVEEQRERAEAELRRARLAELAAQLDSLDSYAADQRQREQREWNEAYDRRQQTLERARAFINEKPPSLPRSRQEIEGLLHHLDRESERRELAERDQARAHIDACERRRLWDWGFRRRYDWHHEGGANACQCRDHRIWRGEEP
jgi:hypothetical protein